MKVYQHIEVDEETPIAFVAIHPLRWRAAWGEPTAMFKDVDLADVPEVQALVDACESARLALYHEPPSGCWATGPLTGDPIEDLVVCPGCRAIAAIDAALAPWKESRDAD